MKDNLKEKLENAKIKILEDEDEKRDAQRQMSWVALLGMVFYPINIIFAEYFNLLNTATILGSLAPTYFIAAASIVGAFFGVEAYIKKRVKVVI